MQNNELLKFDFGSNWNSFFKKVNEQNIQKSIDSILELCPKEIVAGKSVIDIGCGSGINSIAFERIGARTVSAVDVDKGCLDTTNEMILRFTNAQKFQVFHCDILETEKLPNSKFDLVYSWGVLHHTGNMNLAIMNSIKLVNQSGYLFIALYRKTAFCDYWRFAKRTYVKSPIVLQKLYFLLAVMSFIPYDCIRGKVMPSTLIKSYSSSRGMNYFTDIRDWLGGYPYESIKSHDLETLIESQGFKLIKSNAKPYHFGLRGSGCDEFLFKRA
jgi:SAM-dependent methyltransferase